MLLYAADPGCLSRILTFIHPGFRIPDPTIAKKEEEGKICSHKYQEIKNYFIFEQAKKIFNQFIEK